MVLDVWVSNQRSSHSPDSARLQLKLMSITVIHEQPQRERGSGTKIEDYHEEDISCCGIILTLARG